MKKIVITCMITISFLFELPGIEIPDKVKDEAYKKISEITAATTTKGSYFDSINYFGEGKKIYYFEGFDFEGYKEWHPSLTVINNAQMDSIINGRGAKLNEKGETIIDAISPAETYYSIIGYSQGGLTALGYLSALSTLDKIDHKQHHDCDDPNCEDLNCNDRGCKNLNCEFLIDKIDSVITISGAILGAPILDGKLRIKGHEMVGIFARGVGAAVGIFDIGPFDFLLNMGISTIAGSAALEIFWLITPKFLQSFYKDVWYNPSLEGMEQLRDMKPGSDYIKNNVAETKKIPYKAKTGKRVLTSEWKYKKVLGIKIWYLWIGLVDEYTKKY